MGRGLDGVAPQEKTNFLYGMNGDTFFYKGTKTMNVLGSLLPLWKDIFLTSGNVLRIIKKRPFVQNSVCSQFLEGLFAILAHKNSRGNR